MRHFIIWMAWLTPVVAFSQQTDSLKASYLKEVSVYGMPVIRYAAGTKIESLDLSSTTMLSAALAQSSSIYIKNYGNDQLATISFRGTSASHTSVLWNGINISSPTLGQTDFSLLPSFLLEDVNVQYGTASSRYGSDALGGSILLNQHAPEFKPSMLLQYQQQVGSFGRYFEGLKLNFNNDRWVVRTKIMNRSLENNFSYHSPAVGHTKTQTNAAVMTYGIDQQIHYKIADTKWISFEALYTYNHREIQPTIGNDNSKETLRDKNARFNLSYQGDHKIGRVYSSAGYILNDELYNKATRTKVDQLTAIINIDRPIGSFSSLRYGGNASLFRAISDGYIGTKQESRYDLFASFNRKFLPLWNVSVNARQSFYAGRYAPFSPSIGSQFDVIKNENHSISLRSQFSRGYRVPTLNDRYWSPGGNPDIKPEDAYHAEGGATWSKTKNNHYYKVDLTGYRTLVDRWILWQPNDQSIWTPSNLQKVNAHGVEALLYYKLSGNHYTIQSGVNYSYTQSKNLKGLTPSDQTTIGKQLPYVPFHQASFYIKYQHTKWQGNFRINYTGYRYTTLNNEINKFLKSYYLVNLFISRQIELKKISLSALFEANNIMNLYYENYENRAMPGRNFNLSLIINYKSN